MTGSKTRTAQEQEPNRVWQVSCRCGYEEKFRHKEDAQEAFQAHRTPLCGGGSLKAMHAYSKGGVDPEKTLPKVVREA